MRVTISELRRHNTPQDAWMALRGKVYNITPYLAYHPGGVDELMLGAGKDGTKLFGNDRERNWLVHQFCCRTYLLLRCVVFL
jgi:cytochrome b involved in lipid metabolism